MRLPDEWVEAEFYYVTTTGRRTGGSHTIEIWCVAVNDDLYFMAGAGEGSDTVRNLRADPSVAVRVGDDERAAIAEVVTNREEDAVVRAAMLEKYETAPGELASWGRTALPVRLRLARRFP